MVWKIQLQKIAKLLKIAFICPERLLAPLFFNASIVQKL